MLYSYRAYCITTLPWILPYFDGIKLPSGVSYPGYFILFSANRIRLNLLESGEIYIFCVLVLQFWFFFPSFPPSVTVVIKSRSSYYCCSLYVLHTDLIRVIVEQTLRSNKSTSDVAFVWQPAKTLSGITNKTIQ